MEGLLKQVDALLADARKLNADKSETRSRDLSLTITHLEEARYRLVDAIRAYRDAIPF